jgi:hypothetical protein
MRPATWVLALAIALAGCGGSAADGGSADAEPTPPPVPANATRAQKAAIAAQTRTEAGSAGKAVTPAAVTALLQREAGLKLEPVETESGYELLTVPLTDENGVPLAEAGPITERWGTFSLYVAEGDRRLADIASLGDIVPELTPDRSGVVWREQEDALGETFQTAYAFHADGRVMLEWLGGEAQRTDATFDRLQKVLAGLDG